MLHPMPETPVKKTKDRKPAKSSVAKFTLKTARSVAFALRGYEFPSSDDWNSGSETDDWDNKSKNRQPKRKARPLNRVDHKTQGWQRLGSRHTTEVYKTFEQWVRCQTEVTPTITKFSMAGCSTLNPNFRVAQKLG
jgi:hypothetical protein